MADAISELEAGLKEALAELSSDSALTVLLGQRPEAELFEAGRRAVQVAVSPLIWSERLGPMLDTAKVSERLGVTRQALAKAVTSGRMLAVPAGKSRRFPVWQFNFADQVVVRPEVAELLAAFRSIYPEVRPLQVASWAMTPQPELDGATPARWLETAGPLGPLISSAKRTAAALAQ